MEIRTIGIVGAGQMGCGIAHVAALAGFDVVITDIDAEILDQGLASVTRNLDRQIRRGAVEAAQRDTILGRIGTSTHVKDHAACEMVVESAEERLRHQGRDLPPTRRDLSGVDHPGLQHIGDLHHSARNGRRPAGPRHRHALHESGADDAPGRGDSRSRHLGSDRRGRQRGRPQHGQDPRRMHRSPRVRLQPPAHADDQRGDLRGRRERRRHRRPWTRS